MQGIGEQLRAAVERCVQVDEPHVGCCSDATNGLLDGLVPVAGATLEARMTMEDGRHQTNPDFCLWIGHAERVDERAIVTNELVAVVRPVARIGVVESEVDHDEVGLEIHRLSELRQLHIGPVAVIEQGGSRVSEVNHFVAVAQQLLQHYGIGCVLTVAQAIAEGDAVAHTRHALYGRGMPIRQLALCRHGERGKEQAYQKQSFSHDVTVVYIPRRLP